MIADRETYTLGDHITGEAFEGQLKGKTLETWPVFITDVKCELTNHSDALLFISTYCSPVMCMSMITTWFMGIHKRGYIPPQFYRSMAKPIDPRLPKLTQGLGVIAGKRVKYYPMDRIPKGELITDKWGKRIMIIDRSGSDRIPHAFWKSTGEIPMQLLSRWYGFAFTYPNCVIYKSEKENA